MLLLLLPLLLPSRGTGFLKDECCPWSQHRTATPPAAWLPPHSRWRVLLQPQTALLSATLVNQLKGTVSSGMARLRVPW